MQQLDKREIFKLGLEYAAVSREETKLLKRPRQTFVFKLDEIAKRKNEILQLIYLDN